LKGSNGIMPILVTAWMTAGSVGGRVVIRPG
jgi:hypothetical protein